MSATGEAASLQTGATLLEMLVVVAVLAFAVGIGFPTFHLAYDRLAGSVARSAVLADLRAARALALRQDRTIAFELASDGRRYRVANRDVLLPAGVRLEADAPIILFDPQGPRRPAELTVAPHVGAPFHILLPAGDAPVRPGA